ncbi:unnamed protein product [Allacma fusca]|uniref:Uncharacterized protein n=1 Tax=Allacma fusca TaxID=39272 RepID=A0A8J2J8U8_9HEXA|nr:unnamed protein product [Allacma fusca]
MHLQSPVGVTTYVDSSSINTNKKQHTCGASPYYAYVPFTTNPHGPSPITHMCHLQFIHMGHLQLILMDHLSAYGRVGY